MFASRDEFYCLRNGCRAILFYIFINVHIHIYKCIYVSVFALAVRLDVAIAFLYALLAMKRGGCQRCGSVLRGRGVGYCWWCNKHISMGVVTEPHSNHNA